MGYQVETVADTELFTAKNELRSAIGRIAKIVSRETKGSADYTNTFHMQMRSALQKLLSAEDDIA